jgi:hypothetical protein
MESLQSFRVGKGQPPTFDENFLLTLVWSGDDASYGRHHELYESSQINNAIHRTDVKLLMCCDYDEYTSCDLVVDPTIFVPLMHPSYPGEELEMLLENRLIYPCSKTQDGFNVAGALTRLMGDIS